MAKPSLTYFDGRGLGEVPRLLLAEAGVQYDDIRKKDIADLKAHLPFGQVPLYKEGDFELVQSGAIARYIARTHNLYGDDAKAAAHIDMILDGLGDLRTKHRAAEAGDDAAKKTFGTETLPQWLGYFEALAAKGHNGFLVGGKLSLADVSAYYSLDNVVSKFPGALDKFPKLKAHHAAIAARPKIAAWIAARPVTPF
jgi:glutathione S-transferase